MSCFVCALCCKWRLLVACASHYSETPPGELGTGSHVHATISEQHHFSPFPKAPQSPQYHFSPFPTAAAALTLTLILLTAAKSSFKSALTAALLSSEVKW